MKNRNDIVINDDIVTYVVENNTTIKLIKIMKYKIVIMTGLPK